MDSLMNDATSQNTQNSVMSFSDTNPTLKALANTYGTPLYVYDMEKIKANFLAFKTAFGGRKSLICYALKANSNLSILRLLAHLGSGADCVSIGEVKRALIAGIPKYKIIFSGVGKRDEEIQEALNLDILLLNVESYEELLRIEAQSKLHFTKNTNKSTNKARISIRVNPNIDAKTHPYISTGLHENKFGVDIETAKKMYLYAHKSPFLDPIGIHFHIGSQLTDLTPIIQSAQKIAELARSLVALGIELRFFDVGGGLGICYEDEVPISLYEYAQGILGTLSGCDWTIICEPGRRIVGDSGVLLTRVVGEKITSNKRFVIVDGGMNDLMRPALYEAFHRPKLIQETQGIKDILESGLDSSKYDAPQQTLADIVGPVCESSDVFCKDIPLPSLNSESLIGFLNVGAYGFSMANSYNARLRPAEVGIYPNGACLLRARENFCASIREEQSALEASTLLLQSLSQNNQEGIRDQQKFSANNKGVK